MFTAKVIADGRFFMAQIDRDTFRDALKLEAGKVYYGLVFDSGPSQTPYREYTEFNSAIFQSDELEEEPGEVRLIRLAPTVKDEEA